MFTNYSLIFNLYINEFWKNKTKMINKSTHHTKCKKCIHKFKKSDVLFLNNSLKISNSTNVFNNKNKYLLSSKSAYCNDF